MCYVFARLQLNKKVPRQQAPQAVFFADKLRMGLIGVGLIGQVCRRCAPRGMKLRHAVRKNLGS